MQIIKLWLHTHPQTPYCIFVLKNEIENSDKIVKSPNSQQGMGGGDLGRVRMGMMRVEMKEIQKVQSLVRESKGGETQKELVGREEGGEDRVMMQEECRKQAFKELPGECK